MQPIKKELIILLCFLLVTGGFIYNKADMLKLNFGKLDKDSQKKLEEFISKQPNYSDSIEILKDNYKNKTAFFKNQIENLKNGDIRSQNQSDSLKDLINKLKQTKSDKIKYYARKFIEINGAIENYEHVLRFSKNK